MGHQNVEAFLDARRELEAEDTDSNRDQNNQKSNTAWMEVLHIGRAEEVDHCRNATDRNRSQLAKADLRTFLEDPTT
jgi:hypothetical protein